VKGDKKPINAKTLLLGLFGSMVISYLLGGAPIAIIFLILWFEKIIMYGTPGLSTISDVTTIVMALIGIIYGPFVGIFFGLIVIPVLEGIKKITSPFPIESMPFVPTHSNIVDILVAIIAPFLFFAGLPFLLVIGILVIMKYIISGAFDSIVMGKPPPVMAATIALISNGILVIIFEDFFLALIAGV